MPRVVRARYAEALPELLAEEQLRALEAAAFPHMKKGDAQRVQRHYAKQLPHSTERASATVVRPEDLTALGIEVEFSGAAPAVLETTFDPWAEQLEDDDDDGYEEDDE